MSFDDVLRYVLNEATATQDVIRSIFIAFDTAIYYLLQFMYELFFNIATMTLLDGKMIFEIFSRVQLIIGIFMMFQLVMIIIKGIVNPDSFTDAKNGAGHIIMRIIVSLVLLALIVPINIKSPKNEYEKQINNNGILFGTLYSLQYRILANNTMGRLILGDDSTYYSSDNSKVLNIRRYANRFTTEIVKTFYQLNVDSNGEYICHDGFDTIYNGTENISIDELDPIVIIANGRLKCGNARFLLEGINLDTVAATNQYRLTMNWLSTIIGIVLVVVFFMLTFNVATRVFKLAALQLIAPIPIISYMDPKGSKDSAFNAWVKMLSTTYLELFIQLAVIYFSFAIINKFIEKFFNVGNAASTVWNTFIGGGSAALLRWTFIIMVIALFIFAKDAPKFFKQMLGIKDEGKGFFGAFGNAMGLGIAAVGAVGSFSASRQANRDADHVNAKMAKRNSLYDAYRRLGDSEDVAAGKADRWLNTYGDAWADTHAHGRLNRAKNALAGILGAGRGLVQGSAAASESKGNALAKVMAARDAMHKGDVKARAAGRNGTTAISGLASLARETITGENAYDALDSKLKKEEQLIKNRQLEIKKEDDINDHYSKISARVNSKAVTSDKVRCKLDTRVYNDKLADLNYVYDGTDGDFLGGSYIHWDSVSSAAVASGADSFRYEWKEGNVVHSRVIRTADVKQISEVMKDLATDSYLSQGINNPGGRIFDGEINEHVQSLIDAGVPVDEVRGRMVNGQYDMKFNGGGGFKDLAGRKSRATARRKDELNKQSEAVNRARQGDEGQKAKTDSEFGRKGS